MKKVYCKYCKKYQQNNGMCKIVVDNFYAPDAVEIREPMVENGLNNCGRFENNDKLESGK